MDLDLQRVLDHLGLGKISDCIHNNELYLVTTNQGKYVIAKTDPNKAHEAQSKVESIILSEYGEFKRILIPDYTGKLNKHASFVHQNHKYYSIYGLLASK